MILSWRTLGSSHFAESEHGYYVTYLSTDPESKEIRWYAKLEPRSRHSLKQKKWNQAQFFFSLDDAQQFCEEHAQTFVP